MTDETVPAPRPGGAPAGPPFYKRPVLLDANKHAGWSLKEGGNFRFAAETNIVLLNLSEFGAAARTYPIVFTGQTKLVPAVVVGVRTGHNLFVDAAGEWQRRTYVPAYIRRYPFVFVESNDHSRFGLCVDETSDRLVESDVRPLFKNGKPTEVTQRALDFCSAFQRDHAQTGAFVEAVVEKGLLEPVRADFRFNSGEQLSVTGFSRIDEQKFAALPDEVILDWRRRGWLGPIYHHLASALNWNALLDLAAEKTNA